MLRLLSIVLGITTLIYMSNGYNSSESPEDKRKQDRRWLNILFIQYAVVFLGGISVIFFIIFKLVTNQ